MESVYDYHNSGVMDYMDVDQEEEGKNCKNKNSNMPKLCIQLEGLKGESPTENNLMWGF